MCSLFLHVATEEERPHQIFGLCGRKVGASIAARPRPAVVVSELSFWGVVFLQTLPVPLFLRGGSVQNPPSQPIWRCLGLIRTLPTRARVPPASET